MNDGLIDGFRHNAWATGEVLRLCQGLPEGRVEATAAGTYGSIIATLWHIVSSEASYYARLSGEEVGWDRRAEQPPGLGELATRADDIAARWDAFLARPFDAERTLVVRWDDGADRDVPAGVVLLQALHHGNEHRAQICTVLTSIGVAVPEFSVWEYAAATNRATRRGG